MQVNEALLNEAQYKAYNHLWVRFSQENMKEGFFFLIMVSPIDLQCLLLGDLFA